MPLPSKRKGQDKGSFIGSQMGAMKHERKPKRQKVAIALSRARDAGYKVPKKGARKR